MQTQTPCTSQRTPTSLLPSCCLLTTLPTYHLNKNEAPYPHTHLEQEFVLASVFMSVLSTPSEEFIIRGSTECVRLNSARVNNKTTRKYKETQRIPNPWAWAQHEPKLRNPPTHKPTHKPNMSQVQAEASTHTQTHTQTPGLDRGERERDHGTLPCVRLKLVPSMSQVQAKASTHTQTHTQTPVPWLERGERERDHGTFSAAPPPEFDTHFHRLCVGEKVQKLVSTTICRFWTALV
jgi:hypothetical protein